MEARSQLVACLHAIATCLPPYSCDILNSVGMAGAEKAIAIDSMGIEYSKAATQMF